MRLNLLISCSRNSRECNKEIYCLFENFEPVSKSIGALFESIDNNPEEDWPGGINTSDDLYDFGNVIEIPIAIVKTAKKFTNKNIFLLNSAMMISNSEKSFSTITKGSLKELNLGGQLK